MRLPLEHEDGEFADFRLPAGSKTEAFGPSGTYEELSAVLRSRAPHVQQPCSNPSKSSESSGKASRKNMRVCSDFASTRKLQKSIVPPLHGGGQGFESPRLHFRNPHT